MALVRIEARQDARTGKYFVEIFVPHDAAAPFVTTQPRYQSAAAAETDVIAILAATANWERAPL